MLRFKKNFKLNFFKVVYKYGFLSNLVKRLKNMNSNSSINFLKDPLPATLFKTDFDFYLFFVVYLSVYIVFG